MLSNVVLYPISAFLCRLCEANDRHFSGIPSPALLPFYHENYAELTNTNGNFGIVVLC